MNKSVSPVNSLNGTIQVPPDKSISHRSAMFAALAEGDSVIKNYSPAADPQTTLRCLTELGITVVKEGDTVHITGNGRQGLKTTENPIDCENSGTTMRLLSGIIAGSGLGATLTGDESLQNRPMKRIIKPLRLMGCHIEAKDDNYAPLKFLSRNNGIRAIDYELPIASAQLKSCVLLAGLFGKRDTNVIETVPSRNHTELLLNLPVKKRGKGVSITSNDQIEIPLQNYTVPGDFSAAAFWLVAGSIVNDTQITIPNTGLNESRSAAYRILKKMGADIQTEDQHLEGREMTGTLIVKSSNLKAVTINPLDIPNCIDEIPILAVAMLFADGTSHIRGAKELRYKECDRISAMAHMFHEAGADFEELEDGLLIHGNPDFIPRKSTFITWKDHRIAMSAAILALKSEGTCTVKDAECTAISYPGFWEDLTKLMD